MGGIKGIIIAAVCIAVIVAIAFGIRYLMSIGKYKKIISGIKIHNVDLSGIQDGSYTGSFNAAGVVSSKVEVTVKDHKIADIRLVEHKNDRGKPAEVIPLRVVKAQSLKVDTVSGATNSSKVILKAIENALDGGVKE